MSDRTCLACHDVPTRDTLTLCRGCQRRLVNALADCEALRLELEATITRQDRIGAASERPAAKVDVFDLDDQGRTDWSLDRGPVPWGKWAADARDHLKATLVSWVLLVADESGVDRDDLPADTIAACASWLAVRDRWIARHEAAGEMSDEIRGAVRRGWRAVDLPLDRTRVPVGPCPEVEGTEPCTGTIVDGRCSCGAQIEVPHLRPVLCPGEVTAYIPTSDELRPVMACGHQGCAHGARTWTTEQWSRVGERILQRQGREVTWDRAAMQRLAEAIA